MVGTSDASVTSPASSVRFTRSASKRSWSTAVVWLTAQRTSTPSPPTWWSGSGQSQRSSGSTPRAPADAAALAAWLPKVSSTGLGAPVVPEVWMMLWTVDGWWTVRIGTSPRLGRTAGWGGWAGATGTNTAPRRGTACRSSAKAMPGGCDTRTLVTRPDALGGEPPRGACGALVELAVRHGDTAGHDGRVIGPRACSGSEPVLHRPGS